MNTFAAQVAAHAIVRAGRPRPAVELAFPYGAAIGRRVEGAKLLDSIEKALPDSQFAPGVEKALRQLAEVAGSLRDYALADYLQRAARLSNAATARSRRRFPLIVRSAGTDRMRPDSARRWRICAQLPGPAAGRVRQLGAGCARGELLRQFAKPATI